MKKGSIRKLFSVKEHHIFYGRTKNPESRNCYFLDAGLWNPCAVPSVGVLCFRARWEASPESSGVFGGASRLHDLKRQSLFSRDKVPARNTDRSSGFAFTTPKKVFEGSKGRFFKNAPLAGCGTGSHKEKAGLFNKERLFRRGKVPARNAQR